MKKTAAILILLVFLFNVGGYYVLFLVLKTKSDYTLQARLDANDFAPDETIELKLPVTLPYPLQDNGFARVDGKFEHNGNIYKLVKQKLEKDTLYIVCIRDAKEKSLRLAFKEYINLTTDPGNADSTPSLLSKIITDFEKAERNALTRIDAWICDIMPSPKSFELITRAYPILSPPPKV